MTALFMALPDFRPVWLTARSVQIWERDIYAH
jgi:hypothetical protein